MPINLQIKKVLVIGSGPIVIGQAAEFDYAGAQACRALKEENLEVVLINSNPATIMTDKSMASHIYIEPLTLKSVQKIIEIEKPDSLLSTIGGQTGLTLSMELAKSGFLKKHNIQLLGANLETIEKAENRQLFKQTMQKIGQPCVPSMNAKTEEDAAIFLEKFGLPAIIRPDFTLGGSGGGIAKTKNEFFEIVKNGLRASPINQILIEKSIFGWKEIEFEVIRDSYGNVVTVCSMENINPVGIHTGDSFVVAPTLTLSDKEFQLLRSASIEIVNELKVEGGCNCQFALNPHSFEYAVIEVNPRVSRSSALASKATGYSIAKVATKIAIGFKLNEIINKITKSTSACFEPTLDYVVVKVPRWPFDKFIYAKRTLGPQMKSTGEVMSIASNFEHALMKAIQGAELGLETLNLKEFEEMKNAQLLEEIEKANDKQIFAIYEAIKRNLNITKISQITKIDPWFLQKIKNIAATETELKKSKNTPDEFLNETLYLHAKKIGFLNSTIKKLSNKKIKTQKFASFKMVDTCAAEFEAKTPYFYSTFDSENEATEFTKKNKNQENKKVLVLGSGPIRIGQGIEFDYCCVHCVKALKELGFEAIICNNNPETVSTDFDIADRLYFEPINFESIMSIIATEKPLGVIVQFGGQTAIKLTKQLYDAGVVILGTSQNSIDLAENRKRFDKILEKCNISKPKGLSALNLDEALNAANELKYPVLLRPSYVLGGQNMIIAHSNDDVIYFMKLISKQPVRSPILIDKYILGIEVEVDAICDGENCFIPGIIEHVERAGVHSGDSISIYPAQNLSQAIQNKIIKYSQKLAINLHIKGLLNIQFVVKNEEVFVIEANPRSSRTIPYISKVTGVQMVNLATKIIFDKTLPELGFKSGLMQQNGFIAVKVPVFSFEKLHDVDVHLGPEMKSTGEVLGLAKNFEQALFKGLIAAGYKIEHTIPFKDEKGILITVRDSDKPEIVEIAKKFKKLGFKIYATKNTAKFLKKSSINCTEVLKVHEGKNNTLNLIKNKKVQFVISTSTKGRQPALDSVKIRRKSVEFAIPCLTSTDTAKAIVNCIESGQTVTDLKMIDMTKIQTKTVKTLSNI